MRFHSRDVFTYYTLSLVLGLAACGPSGLGSSDDDEASADEPQRIICHGDALEDGVALSDDIDMLRQRWDTNKELLRILFVGEPL